MYILLSEDLSPTELRRTMARVGVNGENPSTLRNYLPALSSRVRIYFKVPFRDQFLPVIHMRIAMKGSPFDWPYYIYSFPIHSLHDYYYEHR